MNLILGDSLLILPTLPANSVDACVTDPPYDLTAGKKGGTGPASVNLNSPAGRSRITTGFMGKAWDGTGIAFKPELWAAVLRVLKPGAHLLAFGGTRTHHRMVCAIEDAGFEIRDEIDWVYGQGFPKNMDVGKAFDRAAGATREVVGVKPGHEGFAGRGNSSSVQSFKGTLGGPGGFARPWMDSPEAVERYHSKTAPATDLAKQWDGWGTALKPCKEPICLARKPVEGTITANFAKWGCGGLNIDGCRIDANGETWLREPGTVQPSESIGTFKTAARSVIQNALGRWPANLIHDGSDEVRACFPNSKSGVQTQPLAKGGIWSTVKGNAPAAAQYGDSGSAARFFYQAKSSPSDREEDCGHLPIHSAAEIVDREEGSDGMNSPRAGAGRTSGRRNNHPTVKPTDLMRYLCRLITPPGGTILDPFMGSGSTGKAARLEGFDFIGIEREAEFMPIARARAYGDLIG